MKLPDIEYNSGNVRPLAKEDTSLPLRSAQVDIDLSKARLGAELNKADAIGQANIRLAREMRETDRQAAWDKAKIAIDANAHYIQDRAMARNANMNLFGTLFNTALSTASHWYEANEEASAAQGSAKYSMGMAELTAKLNSSDTINLDEYPDVDFKSVPENMIYEGVDSVTGQKVRTAPSHLAAPLVFAAEESKIRTAASKGIESKLAQAKFNNAIAGDYEKGLVTTINAKAKHELTFLQGKYEDAIQSRISSADLPGAIDAINSAEARGVFSAEDASKKRQSIVGDVAYSGALKRIDSATNMAQLQKEREFAYSLPKELQTSLRAQINMKENEFEKLADRARTQQEHAIVGLTKLQATQVAMAEGGMKDYAAGVNAITKKWGGDPHLDDYLSEWRQNFNTLKSQEKAQKEQAVSDWYKDPSKPIPAWAADGKDLHGMEQFQAKIKSGEPLITDMTTYNKLQRMSGEDPEQFKRVDLNTMRPFLDDGDMKHFSDIQSKLVGDGTKAVQISNANAVWDAGANQVWGKESKRSTATQAQADGAYRAYTAMIEQAAEANGGKLATSDMQKIADNVFKAKVQSTVQTSGFFGRTTQKAVTLSDPDIAPYLPALTSILQANRVAVTPDALLKEYQAWLKNGRLEELK